ncbi:MAG: isoaspartyl peptidase/L-asparaginase [Catalinimonas sp.]
MLKTLIFSTLLLTSLPADAQTFGIVIHGGAGTIRRENMSPERELAYRKTLTEALNLGYDALARGETSLQAVELTLRHLEDSPLFNAGRGAVFTNEGTNELDASVMDGRTGQAGAVAGVRRVKHPISAALAVMRSSGHVLLTGEGAERFLEQEGLEMVDPSYFRTDERFRQLERIRDQEKYQLDHDGEGRLPGGDEKFGTVGAVALDRAGNLAAGTSTGGMTNKRWNRVGDSPIIGAGTYADNATCAVSATGYGEVFIRNVVAYDIAARMKYQGKSLREAADAVVMEHLPTVEPESGGIIAIDRAGNVAMPFNTTGMYRGYRKQGEPPRVFIYKE